MRTYTVLLMRSCAAAPADVAARVAASWNVNPELSCSRKTCVRSCATQQQHLNLYCLKQWPYHHSQGDAVAVPKHFGGASLQKELQDPCPTCKS